MFSYTPLFLWLRPEQDGQGLEKEDLLTYLSYTAIQSSPVTTLQLCTFSPPLNLIWYQCYCSESTEWFLWVPRANHCCVSLCKALQASAALAQKALHIQCPWRMTIEANLSWRSACHWNTICTWWQKFQKVNTWWGRTFKILETAEWLKAICFVCNKSVIQCNMQVVTN